MLSRRQTLTSLAALGAASAALSTRLFANAPAGKFPFTKTDAEWKAQLSPEAYDVLRKHGTERAFSHPLDKMYALGMYHCAGCDQALFTSDTKYDSKSGWPSFHTPIEKSLGMKVDRAWGMVRTEVHCSNCGGHQGHVFPDGPKPSGMRYCINGVALKFVPADKKPS